MSKKTQKGWVADNSQPIRKYNAINSKDRDIEFLSHKLLKIKLSSAQVTKKQYLKILKILKSVELLNYNSKGIKFLKLKKGEKNE